MLKNPKFSLYSKGLLVMDWKPDHTLLKTLLAKKPTSICATVRWQKHMWLISGLSLPIFIFSQKKKKVMDSSGNNTTMASAIPTLCEEPSASAIQIYETVSWLFENVFQTLIGRVSHSH